MYTIVFDLDDTLYDRAQPLKKAFQEFIKTKDMNFSQFHQAFQHYSEIAFRNVKNELYSLKESHIHRIKDTVQHFGVEISDEEAHDFQALYEENQKHIEVYPHTLELLDYLQAKEIQTFIITNGPKHHQRNKIKNLGLNAYFRPEEIIVSGEEGIAKPDEGIFHLAEKRFRITPTKTWYIGDSYSNDIVGASKVGWNSIWFQTSNEKVEKNIATKTVSSMLELKYLLIDMINYGH